MIIFGLRSGNTRQRELSSYDCSHCHTKQSVQFYFFVRYFHIFWIPVFPLYRSGGSQCSHCKQVLERSQMPPAMVHDYGIARKNVKIPLKFFSGLVIAAIFLGAVILAVITDSNNTRNWLQQPQAGDVYEIKENGTYTLYRIQQVKGDTLVMNPYEYNADRASALRKLKKTYPDAYSAEEIPMVKSELAALYAERALRKIERKQK